MTEKKKTYSTAEVGFSGRVSFDLTSNETEKDGITTKHAHAVLSCKNQANELKFYAKALGGNPDAVKVVTGKDGDEYVNIRLTGFNGTADKMMSDIKKGDLVDVRGRLSRMSTSDYNGETQINMVVNYFRVIATNKDEAVADAVAEASEPVEMVQLDEHSFDEPDSLESDLPF